MEPMVAEPIALIDMDGTLCNYNAAVKRDYEATKSPNDPAFEDIYGSYDEPDWLKARLKLIKGQPGWWARLERHQPGFDVLEIVRQMSFDIHILTKGPWGNSNAWAEKVEWIRKEVPDAKMHLTEDKGLVYGKILVDDYPLYIKRWLQWRSRGLVIMPAWDWNKDFKHPNVVRYDGSNLEEVRERLWQARQSV